MSRISRTTDVNELFKTAGSTKLEGGIINGSRCYWRIENGPLNVYRRYGGESILRPIGSFSEPTNVSIVTKDSFSSYVMEVHFVVGTSIGYDNSEDLLKQRGIAIILEYDKESNTSLVLLISDCEYGVYRENPDAILDSFDHTPIDTFKYQSSHKVYRNPYDTSQGYDEYVTLRAHYCIFDHNDNKFKDAATLPHAYYSIILKDKNKYGARPYNVTEDEARLNWTDSDSLKGWNRVGNREIILYIQKSIYDNSSPPEYQVYGTYGEEIFDFVSRDPYRRTENTSTYEEYIDIVGETYPTKSKIINTLNSVGPSNTFGPRCQYCQEIAHPFCEANADSSRYPKRRKTYSRPVGFVLINYTNDESNNDLASKSILPGFFAIDGYKTNGKISITPIVTMDDWTYGQTPSTPVLKGNTGNGDVTYKYKSSEQEDSAYTTTQPINPGNYVIKAEIAETETYDSGSATDTFSILKISFNPSVSMSNYYDTTTVLPDPVLTGNTSNGTVTYSYKRSGSPDTEYTSTKPTALGNYIVRAVIAETTTYEGKTVTSTFSVLHKVKQKIEPTVSLRNFHIDELAELLNDGNVPIPTVTNNLGNAPVKFMYKRKSKPSTEYTNVFPNDIGAYDIKAYIHESDEYFDAECFGTFSVYNPNVDERDGTTVVSVYSNVEVGNVTDIDTKLYAEYKKNSDTIKDKMSLFTIDSDNRYKILLQGAVNNANEVTVESSISAKIDFIIEKCVIMGDRIICYTDSKQPSYRVVNDILPGTAFTQMAINTQEENDFIIENMPDGHYGYIDVPMYEQYPIMSGSEIASYDYRRIGTNKVSVDNGYAFDRLNSAYYALPEDVPVFSSDEVVITKNGWSISLSGVCRQILTLPLKHIKDYFPDSRIYYETQTTI